MKNTMPPSIRAVTEASNGAVFGAYTVQANLSSHGRRRMRMMLEGNGFTKAAAAGALKAMGYPEPVQSKRKADKK